MGAGTVDPTTAGSQTMDPATSDGDGGDPGGLRRAQELVVDPAAAGPQAAYPAAGRARTADWVARGPRSSGGDLAFPSPPDDGGRGGDDDGDGCRSGGKMVRDRRRPPSPPGSPPSCHREVATVASVVAIATRSPAMTTC
uniref:Uncharacterized protein n=1 Tax=Oryza nivara TaxID=4536 RepID=A0A0E0G925_ORYNI